MKRLNLKLVIILTVSTLCLGLGLYFGHAMQMQSGSSSLKNEAEALAQGGRKERPEALKKYLVYLKQNDSDAETWAKAGKLSVDVYTDAASDEISVNEFVGLGQQAYAVMKSAVRHNLDNPELRHQFAEFLVRNGLFTEAIEHLKWLTDRATHDSKLDVMLANCYELREYFSPDPKNPGRSATEVYARLIGYDVKTGKFTAKGTAQNEIGAYIGLARIMREKLDVKEPKQADEVVAHLVEVSKNSDFKEPFRAHLTRSRYLQIYSERNDPERKKEADSELATAVRLAPEDADVILAAAANARVAAEEAARNHEDKEATKQFGQCDQFLTKGFKLFPKNVEMYRQWALLRTDLGQKAEARKKIELALKEQPHEPTLLWMLATIQLQESQDSKATESDRAAHLNAARATVKQMSKMLDFQTSRKPQFDMLNAQILLGEKQWLPASKEFERLSKGSRSSDQSLQALMCAAECYRQLGEFDRQLDTCRRVLAAAPDDLSAQVGVASALLATGKTDEAQKLYDSMFSKLNRDSLKQPQVLLPVFQFRIADEMKKPAKDRNWQWLESLVKYMEKNEANEANGRDSISLMKSELQYHQGDLDGAYKTLKDAAAKSPDNVTLWSALASIVQVKEKDKGIDAALKVLDDAPAAVHRDVALRLNRASLIARRGGDNVKAALKELDADSDKLSAADRSRLWAGLGMLFYSLGDNDVAISYLLKAAEAGPDDVKIRLNLIEVGRQMGNDKLMSQMVDDMRRIMGPGSDEALYADAARSFGQISKAYLNHATAGGTQPALEPDEKQKLESAIKILDKVSRARPDWYQVALVLAPAELLAGNTDAAIDHYKQALKVGPADPRVIKVVSQLLIHTGRTSEAESIIDLVGGRDKMKELHLGEFVVDADVAKGDLTDALKEAVTEVPENAKDPFGQLRVGRLYAKAGDAENAEKRFRQAVKTGPELPETWLTLVEHLVRNKKREEASSALMQARKQAPEELVNFVLSQGYETIGEDVLAEQYYHAAIDANPNEMAPHKLLALFFMRRNRSEEARKEVMTVLHATQDKPAAKGDFLWARRTLAEILSATGDDEDFRRAKALLDANVKLNDMDSADQLQLANLLATRWDEPASLREAQKYFESIKTSLGLREKVKLANIHDVLGNWSQARAEMLDLIAQAQTPDPGLYVAYVEMLLRHGNVDEADNYLDKLAAIQKTENLLRARVWMKKGRPADAALLVKNAFLPSGPVPKDQASRIQAAAIEMEKIGLDSKAEDLYREYMSYVPGNGALQLAGFLGRKGHIDEALDLCEKALKSEKAQKTLRAVSDVLRGQPRRVEPRHIERVAKWYDRLLAENPGSTSLLMQQADFLILSGEDAKAEQLFRDLLNHSDLTSGERAIAQNDLAFELAVQHKKLDEALRLVNEAGDMIGYRSDLLDTRGMVYLALGRYADAANDFREAVTVVAPSASKFLHLAYARDQAKDREEARSALRSAKDAQLDSATLSKGEQAMYEQLVKDVGP